MKCLSASIVILAGVLSLTASGFISYSGTQFFIGFVGAVVTCLGFLVWGWLIMSDTTAEWRAELDEINSEWRNEMQKLRSSMKNGAESQI
jgi:hypothetical protein